jgi:acyl dehydratase
MTTGVTTKVNDGLDEVRFPSPVPAGGGVQLTGEVTIEIKGSDKPACVARPVFRFYP